MRRLLLAAGLAVILHGLFLGLKADWIRKDSVYRLKPEPVSLTLAYRLPETKVVPPQVKSEKIIPKELYIKKTPEKRVIRPEPPKARLPEHKRKVPPPEPVKQVQQEPLPRETEQIEPEVRKIPEEEPVVSSVPVTEEREPYKVENIIEKTPEPELPPPLIAAVPVYKKNPPPKYPGNARRRGYEGTVVLEVLVNQEGSVEDLRISESSDHSIL
ncbi:MAG: TonB family protein, partial [Deltaproteobacteria bacterium]|nr:TonB family protein [Deltaproteobacteria bacterium]